MHSPNIDTFPWRWKSEIIRLTTFSMTVIFTLELFPLLPCGPLVPGRPRRPWGPVALGSPGGPVAPGWPRGPGGPWRPVKNSNVRAQNKREKSLGNLALLLCKTWTITAPTWPSYHVIENRPLFLSGNHVAVGFTLNASVHVRKTIRPNNWVPWQLINEIWDKGTKLIMIHTSIPI